MNVSVKQGKDGIWYVRPYIGKDAKGKQIKPYKRFPEAMSKEEAQVLADTWIASLGADGSVRSSLLVDLLEYYVSSLESSGSSPNTVKSYRLFTRNYIKKRLGTAMANELTVMRLNRFEYDLLKPKSEGGDGLSRNSVLAVHNFLRGAFNHFVSAGICDSNPMIYVHHPSPERHEATIVDEWDFPRLDEGLERLMDFSNPGNARESVIAFASWLALRTGLRCGEICALRRRDVVRSSSHIHVAGNVVETSGGPWRREVTKGRKSRNVSVTRDDMDFILGFIAFIDGVIGRLSPDSPLVTTTGEWMRPSTLSREFSKIRKKLGLPNKLTFHGLRHTHATWCLANGVDLKTLSERLGHADETTTLRIYSHVLVGRDAAAAEVFEKAVEASKTL